MKSVIMLIACSLFGCLVSAFPGQNRASADQEAARRLIIAVLDSQAEDWNKGDLEGYMKGYWRSDDLTFYSGGDITSGWQATLERYRTRYQGVGREMGQLEFSGLQVELLGSDSAYVRGQWRLKLSSGDAGGLFTLVMRRFSNGWKVVHDHTSSGVN
jgi:beta-aspartyl-peptidase (threonine type)